MFLLFATGWSQVIKDVEAKTWVTTSYNSIKQFHGEVSIRTSKKLPLKQRSWCQGDQQHQQLSTSFGGWPGWLIPKVNPSWAKVKVAVSPSCFCGSRLRAPKSPLGSTKVSFQICPSGERFTECKKSCSVRAVLWSIVDECYCQEILQNCLFSWEYSDWRQNQRLTDDWLD